MSIPLTNFFVQKHKNKFFIDLWDNQENGVKYYEICKANKISKVHGSQILNALKKAGLIHFKYDQENFTYKITYTEIGVTLRNKLLEIQEIMWRNNIWNKSE